MRKEEEVEAQYTNDIEETNEKEEQETQEKEVEDKNKNIIGPLLSGVTSERQFTFIFFIVSSSMSAVVIDWHYF